MALSLCLWQVSREYLNGDCFYHQINSVFFRWRSVCMVIIVIFTHCSRSLVNNSALMVVALFIFTTLPGHWVGFKREGMLYDKTCIKVHGNRLSRIYSICMVQQKRPQLLAWWICVSGILSSVCPAQCQVMTTSFSCNYWLDGSV